MDDDLVELYQESPIFRLDNRFSEPIRNYHYNLKSLYKYWLLTRDLISNKIFKNSEFFRTASWESELPDDATLDNLDLSQAIFIDGDEAEHDSFTIPQIQRNLILSNIFTLVERLMWDVCSEIDSEFKLNGKGSYIQQYCHYIQKNSAIKISKNSLKSFEAFGHLRNSFVHKFQINDIPEKSREHIEELCGPFLSLKGSTANMHVNMFFKVASDFGEDFQKEYWKDFDS